MRVRKEVCRLCKFWGNHKSAMAVMFYEAWSAQVDARKNPGKDTLDYEELYLKYPYGECDCEKFVDMSSNSYHIIPKKEASDFRRHPQGGLMYRDGEGCGACFVTRENFGCVYWKAKGE